MRYNNDQKCLIPDNLFRTYCRFDDLTYDISHGSNLFVIPIIFNQKASDFFR